MANYKTGDYYQALLGKSKDLTDLEGAKAAQSELDRIEKEQYQAEYGPKSFDINEFESLLNRLESSKGRQQRQKSVEGRRDIFAQGLASMMSNF